MKNLGNLSLINIRSGLMKCFSNISLIHSFYLKQKYQSYNASFKENFSIVEKFSCLSAFQRGGRYARRLQTESVPATYRGGGYLLASL